MTLPLHIEHRTTWTPQEFLSLIIEPVLSHLGKPSKAAAQLLLGTALHESGGLKYRQQRGNGPALSFFQMEPATHNDIWRYLNRSDKASLAASIERLRRLGSDKLYELEYNDNYATGMARVHYIMKPEKLPNFNDLDGQANYWKQYYNTELGAGTPTKYKSDWQTYVPNALEYREESY